MLELKIKAILDKADPEGLLKMGAPTRTYSRYAEQISDLLPLLPTETEVAKIICCVMNVAFATGTDIKGHKVKIRKTNDRPYTPDSESVQKLAKQILSAYLKRE